MEILLDPINKDTAVMLVDKHCNSSFGTCPQYRFIEDSGVGFGYDLIKILEGASGIERRIKKAGVVQ